MILDRFILFLLLSLWLIACSSDQNASQSENLPDLQDSTDLNSSVQPSDTEAANLDQSTEPNDLQDVQTAEDSLDDQRSDTESSEDLFEDFQDTQEEVCGPGEHEDQGLCCPEHASNVQGVCVCDDGYTPHENVGDVLYCDPIPQGPCADQPCTDLHRTACVLDESEQGYHCNCDLGYHLDDQEQCVPNIWENCPQDLVCYGGFCLPEDRSQEQCLVDEDCREFYPLAPTYCNPNAAGGICLGCTEPSDCPGEMVCTQYGTCAALCDDDSDCPYGKCYPSVGYCGQKICYEDDDCPNGTTCIGNGSSGMCQRIPCVETQCSPFNPTGSCALDSEACINGQCVSSCDPNPCIEPNRTTCVIQDGHPACLCNPGYVEDNGQCLPDSSECSAGFSCENSYCVDRSQLYFICAIDQDCPSGLSCSPTMPGGRCDGCDDDHPCSPGFDCLVGYCLQVCSTDNDCHPGLTCKGGHCGSKECVEESDCPEGYYCQPGTDINTCKRKPCSL